MGALPPERFRAGCRDGVCAPTVYVGPNAVVCSHAVVCDYVRLTDYARVGDRAVLTDYVQVSGSARIGGDAWLSGHARAGRHTVVGDRARVFGHALVESVEIGGEVRVFGSAFLSRPPPPPFRPMYLNGCKDVFSIAQREVTRTYSGATVRSYALARDAKGYLVGRAAEFHRLRRVSFTPWSLSLNEMDKLVESGAAVELDPSRTTRLRCPAATSW